MNNGDRGGSEVGDGKETLNPVGVGLDFVGDFVGVHGTECVRVASIVFLLGTQQMISHTMLKM